MSPHDLREPTAEGGAASGASPVAPPLRRLAKEWLWRLRGAFIRNPPLPAQVGSIVFVCKGNICRSPFAARLAARLLADQGRATPIIRSAGLAPSQAGAAPPDAVAAAAVYGLQLETHRPTGMSDELLADDALIVVMDAGQLAQVRRRWPQARARTVLLALFDAGASDISRPSDRVNIVDPYGRGRAAFDACYVRVRAAVDDLVRQLPPAAVDRDSSRKG